MEEHKYWTTEGRVHVLQGWSSVEGLFPARGSNVLAICGPGGVGKSHILARLVNLNPGMFVVADKDSLRGPTQLEKDGCIPYNKVTLWDIAGCSEPQLVSMNVGIELGQLCYWRYWMNALGLAKRGLFIPEPEESVGVMDEFINRYELKKLLRQYMSLKTGQVLILEISVDLEEIFRMIFPNMNVLRLYCSPLTRASRLIGRYRPSSRREWTITSLKVLDSLSAPHSPSSTRAVNTYFALNDSNEDAEHCAALAKRLVSGMYWQPIIEQCYAAARSESREVVMAV